MPSDTATGLQWAYVVTRLDYDHWEDDAKEEHHLMGIFLDLHDADEAATKHARRVRSNAYPMSGDVGDLEETTNHAGGVVIKCRTYEDYRDHFIVEVEPHLMGALDDGLEDDSEDEDDDEDNEEDEQEEPEAESEPPVKKQKT